MNCCLDQLCLQQLQNDEVNVVTQKNTHEAITAIEEEDEEGQVSDIGSKKTVEVQVA